MKYNYYDANYDEEVYEDDNLEMILHDFHKLYAERSFLTIENKEKEILQFMLEEGDKWLADIPKMDQGKILQKYVSTEEACILIEKFYNNEVIDTKDFEVDDTDYSAVKSKSPILDFLQKTPIKIFLMLLVIIILIIRIIGTIP